MRVIAFAVLLTSAVAAQQLALERVRPLDPAASGIRAVDSDGKAAVLVAGELRIVLGRPVEHWAVGALPDGRWVVLAGGVASGLDVYLVDPRTRQVGVPFQTSGGLRLPERFGEGLGSWPLAEAPHLLMFAFERAGDCVFVAVDFSGQVPRELASVVLPLEQTRGFDVSYDEATQLIAVEFGPGHGGLEFLHPRAPRLVVEPRAVAFGLLAAGAAPVREVALRNDGGRPLEVAIDSQGPGFAVEPSGARVIAPGERLVVKVTLEPVGGDVAGTLRIHSDVIGSTLTVPVEARLGAAVETLSGDGVAVTAPTGVQVGRADHADENAPPPPPPLPTLLPTDLEGLSLRRLDAEVVRVSGALSLAPSRCPPGAQLVVANRQTDGEWRIALAPSGTSIGLEVDATAGESLQVAVAIGERRGPWLPLGRRFAPKLAIVDGVAQVRVAPSQAFVLVEVELARAGRQPVRILRSWSGRADAGGHAEFALVTLGCAPGGGWLAVGEPGRDRRALVYSDVARWSDQ